jgi:hypothetical protein
MGHRVHPARLTVSFLLQSRLSNTPAPAPSPTDPIPNLTTFALPHLRTPPGPTAAPIPGYWTLPSGFSISASSHYICTHVAPLTSPPAPPPCFANACTPTQWGTHMRIPAPGRCGGEPALPARHPAAMQPSHSHSYLTPPPFMHTPCVPMYKAPGSTPGSTLHHQPIYTVRGTRVWALSRAAATDAAFQLIGFACSLPCACPVPCSHALWPPNLCILSNSLCLHRSRCSICFSHR